MLTLILAIAVAMTVSFLCSVMEAALLSLTPGKLALLSRRHPRSGKICAEFKQDIEKPIAVILILNTAAHTFGAAIAGAQFDKLFGSDYIWLFSLGFTVLMVQYTEILPKTLGNRFNTAVMSATAVLLKYSVLALTPLIRLVHLINRPFERGENEASPGEEMLEELDALAAAACDNEHITPVQERAIRQIPDLKKDKVTEIMVTPDRMVCLDNRMNRDEVLAVIRNAPHSRYPVRDSGKPGAFAGVLETWRMLTDDGDWRRQLRPVTMVQSGFSLLNVAENLDALDSKLLLVEENGEVVGMLTTNDLLDNLFEHQNN